MQEEETPMSRHTAAGRRPRARAAQLFGLAIACVLVFGIGGATAARAAGWIGIFVTDVSWAAASMLRVPSGNGAVVLGRYRDGPAVIDGLFIGDVIVAVDGAAVADTQALVRALGPMGGGDAVSLKVYRFGRSRFVSLTLQDLAEGQTRDTSHKQEAGEHFRAGLTALESGDMAGAAERLTTAADMGHAEAQYRLAKLYERGQGVDRDLGIMRTFQLLAALGRHGPAARALSENYELGPTVAKDDVLAYRWLTEAAGLGDDVAGQRLDAMNRQVDPAVPRRAEMFARIGQPGRDPGFALPPTSRPGPRSWVGVVISTPPAELLDEVGLAQGAGAYVVGVVPGSPAWQAGLEPGQVITRVNVTPISHWLDFIAAVSSERPGTFLNLTVATPDRPRTLGVTLAEPPATVDYQTRWDQAHAAAVDGLKGGNKGAAVQEIARLAREGHGPSQSRLGTLYERSDGVGRDNGQALNWYRVAASQGRARRRPPGGFL